MILLSPRDPTFPPLLAETPRPPRALFIDGDATLLTRPAIAVVGTRAPSAYGLRAAYRFARALAELGFVVVSGLARGIDTAAHQGALAAGGDTVAVLGHGLDRVYPAANRALAARLRERGCLVAEYPVGTPPRPHHFPERNRIIAGLTLGALVIEATPRSGSLITARCALEANREVFAVPGAFDDNAFAGSHELLKQGAKLVTSPQDLIDELRETTVTEAARFARPSLLVGDAALLALGACFDDEPRALGELVERYPGGLPALLLAIEKAHRAGWLAEVAPQQYLWTSPIPNTIPTSG